MQHRQRVWETLAYIEQNLHQELTLEELAGRAYLSKYYYHRLFRELTGEPVGRYITRRRLTLAARELTQTHHPVVEIALRCRFGSQEAFTRAFKRTYGCTPGQYRRLGTSGASSIRMAA